MNLIHICEQFLSFWLTYKSIKNKLKAKNLNFIVARKPKLNLSLCVLTRAS